MMTKVSSIVHYYGDIVRRLFMVAAGIMLITLPLLNITIPVPFFVSVLAILVIAILAGLTNPEMMWVAVLNVVLSIGALVVFEYYSFISCTECGVDDPFFWINQILALIFLCSLYFSMKTWRGMVLEGSNEDS